MVGLPNMIGEIVYPSKEEVDRLFKEYKYVVEFVNAFLDYKVLVNSSNEVEAVLLLKTYGGPTIWWWLDEKNCEFFDELVDMLAHKL